LAFISAAISARPDRDCASAFQEIPDAATLKLQISRNFLRFIVLS
jgi:hypothetical protein